MPELWVENLSEYPLNPVIKIETADDAVYLAKEYLAKGRKISFVKGKSETVFIEKVDNGYKTLTKGNRKPVTKICTAKEIVTGIFYYKEDINKSLVVY